MKGENWTDIDRLHAVVNMDNPGRGAGRTFAECHTAAGAMETTNEGGVICLVDKYESTTDIMRLMVFKVFPDHDIHFHKTLNRNKFIFYMPDKRQKQIQFVSMDHVEELAAWGKWPVVEFTRFDRRKGELN